MKPVFVALMLVCSSLIANAQPFYVHGKGNSFVTPGSEIIIQLVEDAAKNVYENLEVAATDS